MCKNRILGSYQGATCSYKTGEVGFLIANFPPGKKPPDVHKINPNSNVAIVMQKSRRRRRWQK